MPLIPRIETPDPGEVIWADDQGVTCRRWNWRQGRRTALHDGSCRMWFVLERLDPMPIPALIQAGMALWQGLRALAPAAEAQALILDQTTPQGRPMTLG